MHRLIVKKNLTFFLSTDCNQDAACKYFTRIKIYYSQAHTFY